jgi:hypothetical protein
MLLSSEVSDTNSKIALVVKEAKASAATVKLGEKQIDSITEKMEAFRNENVKFKSFVKERLYQVEVRFVTDMLYIEEFQRSKTDI